jgi:hypothetical protein
MISCSETSPEGKPRRETKAMYPWMGSWERLSEEKSRGMEVLNGTVEIAKRNYNPENAKQGDAGDWSDLLLQGRRTRFSGDIIRDRNVGVEGGCSGAGIRSELPTRFRVPRRVGTADGLPRGRASDGRGCCADPMIQLLLIPRSKAATSRRTPEALVEAWEVLPEEDRNESESGKSG